MNKQYFYLHENGNVIRKNPIAYNAQDFIESPFVTAYWLLDLDDENQNKFIKFILEVLGLGANIDSIWHLTDWIWWQDAFVEFYNDYRNKKEVHEKGMDRFMNELHPKAVKEWEKEKENR